MTIVALHHTGEEIYAIADGLISRGDNRVLEQDQKIITFEPRYKIPRVGLGHFSHFDDFTGGQFGLAYAGNFTLIATIVKKFLRAVEHLMYLDRDDNGGKPQIYRRENFTDYFRGQVYSDSYNFSSEELLPITVGLLSNVLHSIALGASLDFSKNAMSHPDASFVLFGVDEIKWKRTSRAQTLKYVSVANGKVGFLRYSILPWSLSCIGDATVLPNLVTSVDTDVRYNTRPASQSATSQLSEFEGWIDQMSAESAFQANREGVIQERVLQIIERNEGTIGGDCTIAKSAQAGRITISTIRKDDIPAALKAMQ